MATTLYVGNLAFSTTENDVLDVFRLVGSVLSCKLVIDRTTNRSRGFAFVEMDSAEQAERAIADFHGQELDGRPLTVKEARPREDRRMVTNGNRSMGNPYEGLPVRRVGR